MASGALMACEQIWRRPIRFFAYAIGAIAILTLVARSCSLTGGPVSGRVIDVDSGQPIANAHVVVRWIADPPGLYSHPVCFHVETALSTTDGKYGVPLWLNLRPWGFFPNAPIADAYRQGYESVHAHSKEAEGTPDDVYMKKFLGSDIERFEYISGRVFSGIDCLGAGTSRRNLFSLFAPAIREARQLAHSQEQQRNVEYRMRQIAATAWLAEPTDSRAEPNALAKLPTEIRKELE